MQTARNYVTDATNHMGQALDRMSASSKTTRSLPVTLQEITRYVEQLLTPEQEAVCDMATD